MSEGHKPATLVAQQQAVLDYLDALLREIPEDDELEPAPVAAAPAPVVAEEIQDWDPAALAAPAPVREAPPALEPVVVAAPPPAEPVRQVPVVPEWAQPEFQALLFSVGKLQLAVPLVKLHSVVPWSEQVTPIPRQPHWCHGLLRYRERNVKVVDTARLVLPSGKQPADLAPQHILVLDGGAWGLSCSAIGKVVRLRPDEVKWRAVAGQRPWLAGTVLAHLCALLDCEALAAMLSERGRGI